MALSLTLRDGPGDVRETRQLVSGTLSIGRGAGNDWVLADPDRDLSKSHCVIAVEQGRAVLTDLSANGTFVNGARQPTGRDRRVALTDGDEFRIGPYVIEVAETTDERPAQDSRSAEPGPLDIDLLDPAFEWPGADRPSTGRPLHHPAPSTPPARRPDTFDLAEQRRGPPGDDSLLRGIVAWEGGPQRDDADAPRHAMPPPRVVAPDAADFDFDALIGEFAPATSPVSVAQPQATPPADAPSGAGAGLAAFLEGAGLDGAGVAGLATGGDPAAALRAAGEVFRAMAEGLREALISRAMVKSELRVEQTLLRGANNNPLKFSVTPDAAVAALLDGRRPGYLPPVVAARQACDDLKSHEVAVMAGVQEALAALTRRFDPDALERRMAHGPLASLLPAARKARAWDEFRRLHADIVREAEDDFQALFGRAFVRAYQDRVRKG